jgi:hypothetical protein
MIVSKMSGVDFSECLARIGDDVVGTAIEVAVECPDAPGLGVRRLVPHSAQVLVVDGGTVGLAGRRMADKFRAAAMGSSIPISLDFGTQVLLLRLAFLAESGFSMARFRATMVNRLSSGSNLVGSLGEAVGVSARNNEMEAMGMRANIVTARMY